jgi:hypothetical protein
VRCIDVAALVAAAFLRTNRTARVMPFEQDVVEIDLNPRDSVMTNAGKLAAVGGGGTNCSAPLERLVKEKAKVDLLVFVSDNESWAHGRRGPGTAMMQSFRKLKAINPGLKMVCVDVQPYGATQAIEGDDILNVGGFSDAVFEMIGRFADGRLGRSTGWARSTGSSSDEDRDAGEGARVPTARNDQGPSRRRDECRPRVHRHHGAQAVGPAPDSPLSGRSPLATLVVASPGRI